MRALAGLLCLLSLASCQSPALLEMLRQGTAATVAPDHPMLIEMARQQQEDAALRAILQGSPPEGGKP